MSATKKQKLARQREHQKRKEAKRLEEAFKPLTKSTTKKRKAYVSRDKSFVRDTKEYPSFSGTGKCGADGGDSREYTGDYVVGLATTHKSNIVPVGRGDDPKQYSTMRRN